MARYLGGLRQSLHDVLSMHSFWTVSEAYQRALIAEKQQNRRQGGNNRPTRPQEARTNPPGPQESSSNPIRCYRCGEQGHRANECRRLVIQKGKNLFVEDNEVRDDSKEMEYGEPKYDEYTEDNVLCGDGHENLVVRQSF